MAGGKEAQAGPAANPQQQPIPTIQIMSAPSTPTTTASRAWRESRDTGFPEPFGDNFNTRLPHPDADLSPNASISQDSLTMEQAMKRRRLSFLSKSRRRTASQGSSINTQAHAIHSVLSIVGGQIPSTPVEAMERPATDSSGASKDSISSSPPGSPSRLRRWLSSRR